MLCAALLLAACSTTTRERPVRSPPVSEQVPVLPAPLPPPPPPPAGIDAIPDAVPRIEPRSTRGNPVSYVVFGKRYFVMASADGYRERGVASWYGPDFHTRATSSGEPYDMYGMTAAHKTLPLPTYARVTNISNGRSIVVRINDRGPFVGNRVIDLSYTAAHKLDMTRDGTAFVEIEALSPGTLADAARNLNAPQEVPPLSAPVMYLQAGAFGDAANANAMAQRLRNAGIEPVRVLEPGVQSRLYRVRVGPVADVTTFDELAARIDRLGIQGRLVTE
jgi:rare lipoprotein A